LSAQRALDQLFNLGGYARDAVLTDADLRTPEYHIRGAVRKFHDWAMKDCDLTHTAKDLSLFEIVTCDKYTPSYIAEQKMIRKLGKLLNRWDDAFEVYDELNMGSPNYVPEELPTLYGVIASHTVMAFVSYVPLTETVPKASLRTIGIFDYSKDGFDVWNSIAIAIFIIHCRNRMKQLKEFIPEPVAVHSDDPDL
jgi:hypothetical protein